MILCCLVCTMSAMQSVYQHRQKWCQSTDTVYGCVMEPSQKVCPSFLCNIFKNFSKVRWEMKWEQLDVMMLEVFSNLNDSMYWGATRMLEHLPLSLRNCDYSWSLDVATYLPRLASASLPLWDGYLHQDKGLYWVWSRYGGATKKITYVESSLASLYGRVTS